MNSNLPNPSLHSQVCIRFWSLKPENSVSKCLREIGCKNNPMHPVYFVLLPKIFQVSAHEPLYNSLFNQEPSLGIRIKPSLHWTFFFFANSVCMQIYGDFKITRKMVPNWFKKSCSCSFTMFSANERNNQDALHQVIFANQDILTGVFLSHVSQHESIRDFDFWRLWENCWFAGIRFGDRVLASRSAMQMSPLRYRSVRGKRSGPTKGFEVNPSSIVIQRSPFSLYGTREFLCHSAEVPILCSMVAMLRGRQSPKCGSCGQPWGHGGW